MISKRLRMKQLLLRAGSAVKRQIADLEVSIRGQLLDWDEGSFLAGQTSDVIPRLGKVSIIAFNGL